MSCRAGAEGSAGGRDQPVHCGQSQCRESHTDTLCTAIISLLLPFTFQGKTTMILRFLER